MIKSVLIGQPDDVKLYAKLMGQINYFSKTTSIIVDPNRSTIPDIDYSKFHAVFFISPITDISDFLEEAIRSKANIYLVDQPSLSVDETTELLTLHSESNNLLFPEARELFHPLVQDFIDTHSHHLLFRYNKTISEKKQLRATLYNALCFLTIMSPMQVKKIDINSIATTNKGRPAFKIRLKMFDSSIGYVFLKMGMDKQHSIIIESKNGNFIFNLTECYLENVHGARFNCLPTTETDTLIKSLEEFALCIILNKKPNFNFYHYTLVSHLLFKIENIILLNF